MHQLYTLLLPFEEEKEATTYLKEGIIITLYLHNHRLQVHQINQPSRIKKQQEEEEEEKGATTCTK